MASGTSGTNNPVGTILSGAQAVTQWGIGFAGACGEAALAVAQGILTGNPPSVQQVVNLVKQGARFGVAPNGTSTPNELMGLGAATGTPLTRGPGGSAALTTIDTNLAAGRPTILNLQNAKALGGSDRNVSGHYITVVGKSASGNYIVADSNQPQALQGQFIQYSSSQILNAKPFATLTPQGSAAVGSVGGIGGLTSDVISQGISSGLQGVASNIFGGFGVAGASDFAWRAALIVGGMVLIVVGLLVFFSHQEGQAVEIVQTQASNAAKAVTAAAA